MRVLIRLTAPAEQIMVLRPLPNSRGNPNFHNPRPLRDEDISTVKIWLNRRLKWETVNKTEVFDAIQLAARERIISPIRHYIEGLPPMEVDEAHDFLTEVLNTHFSLRRYGEHPDAIRYSELVFRKWLISAVARALRPACKADHVLILEGAQGAGKSTAIRILCGDAYFGDSLPKLDSKDAADYVRGKWIIELAELSSVSKTEVEHVKALSLAPRRSSDQPMGVTKSPTSAAACLLEPQTARTTCVMKRATAVFGPLSWRQSI